MSITLNPEDEKALLELLEKFQIDKRLRDEGKKEGEESGVSKERKRNIEKMLSKGNSVEDVANMLDLSVEEVYRLWDQPKQDAAD